MTTRLIDYFNRFRPLTPGEAQAIADSAQVRTCAKGTVLLEAGQAAIESYFVLGGCVRKYYVVDGEEKTSGFFMEDDWVIAFNGFGEQPASGHYLVCLEACSLVVGTADKETDLFDRFPDLQLLSRQVLEKVMSEQQALLASYITGTPEQRYLHLLKTRPELIHRVPQYQLASYIGVKPESLSRIRKRMALRKEP